ncbi:MAG: orotidine-5'-phosphate decarboxylase [Pseudomonadota bacterium]
MSAPNEISSPLSAKDDPTRLAARDRLIVALDAPNRATAERLLETLGDSVTFYKIGLELLFADGLALASDLKAAKKRVFLDLKFLDIGNTVERAVAQASALGLDCLTVHGTDRKTLAAAVRGRDSTNKATKLLAVTVLTNLDANDLADQGISQPVAEIVKLRANHALAAGFDGVVASGQEASVIRSLANEAGQSAFWVVTPGIRLPASDAGDQTRVTTPADAIAAGASHLVVGRPITQAADPAAAATQFTDHIATATASGAPDQ